VGKSVGVLTVWLTARETAALMMVAVSLVFFRSFRRRYLVAWGAGWAAYAGYLALVRASAGHAGAKALAACTQADLVLAMGLFAAAALMCAESRPMLTIPVGMAWIMLMAAAVAPVYHPEIPYAGVEIACRVIAAGVAIELMLARLGRVGLGPFLFAAGLVTLHGKWTPFTNQIPNDGYLLAEILFGSSLLLVALDDSRVRTHRLGVLTDLSSTIAHGQSHSTIMQAALGQLTQATKAKAAWFHRMEGGNLKPALRVGLTPEELRGMGQTEMGATMARIVGGGCAAVVRLAEVPEAQELLKGRGIRQVVLMPVVGKESTIGMLSLGFGRRRRHGRDELEFLETAAQKLGISAENAKLLEQVLRSQLQWVNTFDSIQDLILAHDGDYRILKANQALLQRLGRSPAEVLGSACGAVLPKEEFWSGCPYCERGGGLTEGIDPCFGGQSVVSTSTYAEHGQQVGTIHVVQDATDRHAAEEKYRMLFEQAQEGVFVATLEGDLLDCNDAFVTMLGYGSRDELKALDLAGVLGATAEEREAFRSEIEAHNYARNFEMTVRRKDGALLMAALSCFATRDGAGRIERYQGFVLDITEKKRSEDEMRRRNRELNALNAMAVIATQSFDLDEILNLTLRQVVSLFGAETGSVYLAGTGDGIFRRRAGWGQRSEARMKFAEAEFPEGLGELVMRSRAEVVTQEFLPHLPPAVVEFICADRLPYWIWVLLWSKDKPLGMMGLASNEDRRYSSNDENLLVAISRQLAMTVEKVLLYEETSRAYEDLRRTQEQLLQSEKMSAIGQLISGVAHELNNPLTAILGYAQLLEGAGLDERSADYVGKLFKQAQRTHRIVQNLLSFARQRKPQKQELDLRKVLEETLTLSEYDLKVNNIALEREIPNDLPSVVGDCHQLEQVFLNIINNALDAVGEGSGRGFLRVRVTRKEAQVCVEFEDNGPGIKEPSRIFDPFYTTKSQGKGTGLGLSICYGIVKEHRGEIVARNRPEGGAVIEVRLPASEKPAELETTAAARRESMIMGRVLLVEDEEAVLEFERDVLAGAGAEVAASTTMEEAKERLRAGRFDAVVMNGRMPGEASAQEVYEWIAANAAGMEKRLVLTFSSMVEEPVRTFLQERNVPILAKPFGVGDLIGQVRLLAQSGEKAASAGAGA